MAKTGVYPPHRISVLSMHVGADNFDEFRDWLEHHCPNRWKVRYIEETGLRTVVGFENSRDKFLFDIAWANSLMPTSGDWLGTVAFARGRND